MSKVRTVWYCSECGNKQMRWTGQCLACESWNSFSEESEIPLKSSRIESVRNSPASTPLRIKEVDLTATPRIETKITEFDRMIGGGVVTGSLSLVGGNPGIGKSTLLLQISNALAHQGLVVLYICGEESVSQTSIRALRLGISHDNLLLLSETNFSRIKGSIDKLNPDVIIVDSIQIVYKDEISSAPGSVSQVRETATEFMHIAKGRGIATFLIGHVTKSGEIAGPRVLEHLVDTVLYFEGDKQNHYRMMRVIKNRFGPTDEIAIFTMQEKGLKEVFNPSQLFLEERRNPTPGTAIIPTIEGSRPIMIEVQALVTETFFSTPSRRSTGFDQNRLALLLAVLEKRVGYKLFRCDVFVSIAGGLRINEPAIDLGLLLAIASSFTNQVLDMETIIIGEVGLTGEIRSVPKIEKRIKEALNMGFKRAIIPRRSLKGLPESLTQNIEITTAEYVEEAIHALIQ